MKKDRQWVRYRMRPNDVQELFYKYDGLCHLCKTNPATDIDHRPGTGHEYKNGGEKRVRTAVPPQIRGATCRTCNEAVIKGYDAMKRLGVTFAEVEKYCNSTVYCNNEDKW